MFFLHTFVCIYEKNMQYMDVIKLLTIFANGIFNLFHNYFLTDMKHTQKSNKIKDNNPKQKVKKY